MTAIEILYAFLWVAY